MLQIKFFRYRKYREFQVNQIGFHSKDIDP